MYAVAVEGRISTEQLPKYTGRRCLRHTNICYLYTYSIAEKRCSFASASNKRSVSSSSVLLFHWCTKCDKIRESARYFGLGSCLETEIFVPQDLPTSWYCTCTWNIERVTKKLFQYCSRPTVLRFDSKHVRTLMRLPNSSNTECDVKSVAPPHS